MIILRMTMKLKFLIAKYFGFYELDRSIQEIFYKENGLDREAGLEKLNQVLIQELGVAYNEQEGMFSEHLIMLASISLSHTNIANILEIGTYDGRAALIISRLFPNASIVTIDLPEDEAEFSSTYDREHSVNNFLAKRNQLLSRSENVRYVATNSLNLCNANDKYDLIWVDGAHGYPAIACDIANSIRLLSPEGILMVDDIWTSIKHSDAYYRSVGGHETLNAHVGAGTLNAVTLFNKRLGGTHNYPGAKKYVAFVRKCV
ncbi:class I SAM-dependent methyltransferase [Planktomarina sp.]|nr:class I SAM-dependent methyltransferase [Planktomarina sp.]